MENQVTVEKEKLSTKELVIKILKIAGNVVFYAIICLLLLFSIMNIRGSKDAESYPNIFGRGMLAVLTPSMDGDQEDSFKVGDLIIVKTFKEKDFDELEVGDVVTYYDPNLLDGKGGLNSHRIVEILYENGKPVTVIVQGDKSVKDRGYTYAEATPANKQDLMNTGEAEHKSAQDILGVMIRVKPGAGKTLLAIQEYWFFIFVIPVLIFLLVEIFIVVKNVLDLKNEKAKEELKKTNEELKADLEAQKEALRAEILAELKKESLEEPKEE